MNESDNDSQRSAKSLLMSELYELCSSDSLSEEGLRDIIEGHKLLTPNENNHYHDNMGIYQFFFAACHNERVTEGIIRYLLEYFPAAASSTDYLGRSPLHFACINPNVSLNIVQLLIDAAPDSVRSVNNDGHVPLHYFCDGKNEDDGKAMQILKLLIERHPGAVRHAENDGFLPIHMAACNSDPQFCRLLIEAYPGSERVATHLGGLPLHCACATNTVATVEYFYKLYPDAINHAATSGFCSIHFAIYDLIEDSQVDVVEVVEFLLDCDPNVKLQKLNGLSLLHVACDLEEYNDSNIEAGIQVIKVIYDAHPEAIEENKFASNIYGYHPQVQAFINSQLVHARQARDPV